jgi:hypothetical protein
MPKKKAPPRRKKAAPKSMLGQYTDKAAYERLAVIRQQNVEHHAGYASKQHLRRNIMRHQINHTHQLELDRLKSATVQGGLHAAAEARVRDLENMLIR